MGTLHELLSLKVRFCFFSFFILFFFFSFFPFKKPRPIGEDGLSPDSSGPPVPRRNGVRRSTGDLLYRAGGGDASLLQRIQQESRSRARWTNHLDAASLRRRRFLQPRSSSLVQSGRKNHLYLQG